MKRIVIAYLCGTLAGWAAFTQSDALFPALLTISCAGMAWLGASYKETAK